MVGYMCVPPSVILMNTNLNKLRGLLYLYILIVFGDTLTSNNICMGVTPGNLSLTFDRKNIDQSDNNYQCMLGFYWSPYC